MVVQIGTEFVGGICASGPPKALLDETCRPASKFALIMSGTLTPPQLSSKQVCTTAFFTRSDKRIKTGLQKAQICRVRIIVI